MKQDLQAQLVRRVLAHLDARSTDANPTASTVPIEAYADATRIDRERARIFRELPLIVGHISQIPAPGDFFTHDASGVPLLLVRDDAGEVRAMLNVCRHRGTRLENRACGNAKAFVCPYHAWSYGRDGELIGVPHERAFLGSGEQCGTGGLVQIRREAELRGAELEREARGATGGATGGTPESPAVHAGAAAWSSTTGLSNAAEAARAQLRVARSLVEVPVGVVAGLIMVRPTPVTPGEPRVLDAAAWLGPLAAELESFGLGTSHAYGAYEVDRALSWKLSIDIFLETYHLRTAHKDSIYPLFFDNVGLVDPSGPHLRNIFPKRSIKDLVNAPEDTWSLRHHANVLYHLFPNTLVLVEPDHAAILHLWPIDAERTHLQAYMLVPEAPMTEKAQTYWDANNAILLGATAEDFALGESIQRGLASGANREVAFGAFEHALAHFHAQVDENSRDR
ncbi:MAG TPA: SRPBCC family protein [Kofleriaceae bacterium]|jgi:phenylpropionate dioxygenase-like ring-hydroxylating dioxygenase large terminal subunit